MLPCKAVYFILMAKEISFRMNLVLFLTSIGLSKSKAGLVVGMRLMSVIICAPFFGMVADKFKIHRTVITLCSLVAFVSTCAQSFLAYRYGPTHFLYCANRNNRYKWRTSVNSSLNLNITGEVTIPETPFKDLNINRLFWLMFAINIFQSFFDGGLDGFVDVGVMVRLKQRNEKPSSSAVHHYGTQRIPSVFGQAIGPVVINYVIDKFPFSRVTCYTGVLATFGLMQLMYMASLLWLFNGLDFSHDVDKDDDEIAGDSDKQEMIELPETNNKIESVPNFKVTFRKTLFEEEMMMMLVSLFFSGLFLSQFISYSFPYMNDLQATTMDLNIFMVVISIGSLIGFLVCHKIIHLCGGPFQALILTFCAYVVKFIAMASSNSPIVISIFQILSMFDMPITETVCLGFVMRKSPKAVLTSMISVINAIQYSLPDVIGGALGGFVYESYSGKILFYICSMLSAIMAIIIAAWIVSRKYCRHNDVREDVKSIVVNS